MNDDRDLSIRMGQALRQMDRVGVKERRSLDMAPDLNLPSLYPKDVPGIRIALAHEWRNGGPLERVAAQIAPVQPGVDRLNPTWERRTLKNAELWYVGANMLSLIDSVAKGLPGDARMEDFPLLGNEEDLPSGLVVFEKPLVGLDADDPNRSVTVHGFTFGPVTLSPMPRYRAPGGYGLAISTYQMIDLGLGLDESFFKSPTAMALMAEQKPGVYTKPGQARAWAPLGWSSWPAVQELDDPALIVDENRRASLSEDRRWLAALMLVAYSKKLATLARMRLPRQERRPSDRLKLSSDINVVQLREIKTPPPLDGSMPEERDVDWSCRWVVQAHPCWQRYGPGNVYRKLIVRGPFLKGPPDKPLRLPKTTVKALIR